MANHNDLKTDIRQYIYSNQNEEITGNILRDVLLEMVDTLGDGWTYKGVATTTANPGTPDSNVFYIATAPGTYTNFKNSSNVALEVADGEVAILKYNGSWAKDVTGAATSAQVTQLGQEVDENERLSAKLAQIGIFATAPNTNTDYYKLTNKVRIGHKYAIIITSDTAASACSIWEAEDIASSYRGTLIAYNVDIIVGENYFEWTSARDNCGYINIYSNTVLRSATVTIKVYCLDTFVVQDESVTNRSIDYSTLDSYPTPNSQNLAISGGIADATTEHGGTKIDALYKLRKLTSSNTATDDANGTRIRIVFTLANGCFVSAKSNYLLCADLYGGLNSAILAAATKKEAISDGLYSNEVSGTLTQGGYLTVSMKKSDDSAITDDEKAAMLSDVLIQIYRKDSMTDLIVKRLDTHDDEIAILGSGLSTQPLEISDYVISLNDGILKRMGTHTFSDDVKIVGKNLLDKDSIVQGKIINDSGNEVSDTSSYYGKAIPCHGKTIVSSFVMQRVYKYAADGTFLGREGASNDRTIYTADVNTYFVKVQVQSVPSSPCIVFGADGDTTYEVYTEYNELPRSGFANVYAEDGSSITLNANIYCKAIIPEVGTYDFWEPASVTDDYKCTSLGQYTQSIPSLNTLGYDGFLSTYFDNYLGKYSDGYEVKKIELGMDSGAEVEQSACPLFSYEFIPKYYNKTVLLSAGMNTCEASTYFGLAYFINALMAHTEDGMLALYKTTRFVVIPIICPTGVLHDPLLYRNANDVRINKNFSYLGSWKYNVDRGGQYPGAYPDSEVETKLLKAWMNKYNGATFYMDCHSDTGGATGQELALSQCFCSDTATKNKVAARKDEITAFYRSKGYIAAGDTPTFRYENEGGLTYPKTTYSKAVCGTPAIMHEQYIMSTAYGSDGHTNNDDYGIKNYAALIRWYCLIMCKGDAEIID